MPTWRALWSQRLRWQRGAVDNLGAYGLRPQTLRYWAQQLGIGYGVIALTAYLSLLALMALSMDRWVWFPFWLGVGWLFMVERVVTAWRGGWRARLLAATLLPELGYAMFLNVVYVKGIIDMVLALGKLMPKIYLSDVCTIATAAPRPATSTPRRPSEPPAAGSLGRHDAQGREGGVGGIRDPDAGSAGPSQGSEDRLGDLLPRREHGDAGRVGRDQLGAHPADGALLRHRLGRGEEGATRRQGGHRLDAVCRCPHRRSWRASMSLNGFRDRGREGVQ